MLKGFFTLVFLLLLNMGIHARAVATQLDQFLGEHQVHVTEGYCSPEQKQAFAADLQVLGRVTRIAEIGFNAGHSAEFFLENCPDTHLVSFDINHHSYTAVGVEFFKAKYSERFEFIAGDSKVGVPNYAQSHPNIFFDLIFIDGGHSFDDCYQDIVNCRLIAHPQTVVWIDDYNYEGVKRASDTALEKGLIKILDVKEIGGRHWAVAQYLSL
jgi:predicted O-methyltransferase YrrM